MTRCRVRGGHDVRMTRTHVLVHGAFCGAAVWSPLVRELTLRGHRALAVDLPGHGLSAVVPDGPGSPSGIAGTGTADDVAAVAAVVARAAAHGPVVLVGHSRGGLTITAVANAVPELLDRTVYVGAWCPAGGTVDDYQASPEAAQSLLDPLLGRLLTGDPATLGALRVTWPTTDEDLLDGLQRALLADGTRDELRAYLHTQDADESLHIDEAATRVDPAAWGAVPHTYVRLLQDRSLPLALQDRFIADADALLPDRPFDVHDLDSSHLRAQLHPQELADVLDGLPATALATGG